MSRWWVRLRRTLIDSLGMAIVLALRVVRPIILVRFGGLRNDRIGHLSFEPELYLCERDADVHRKPTVDVFFLYGEPPCNRQLARMWQRRLHVWRAAAYLDMRNRRVPGHEVHTIALRSSRHEDPHDFLGRTPPHLTFTKSEQEFGEAECRSLGIARDQPFVCFMNRDAAYMTTVFGGQKEARHIHRNSHIENYVEAARELTQRGYVALRMGARVEAPLSTSDAGIVDYASRNRSEFMDVYLCAHCRFLIAPILGFCGLAYVFRRPLLIVNAIPLVNVTFVRRVGDLFIPKKCWLTSERRFMTFKEILQAPARHESHEYVESGIEVVENSAEEIAAATAEMDERLRGTWRPTEEDEDLQRRFWALFGLDTVAARMRIGSDYLRSHKELLN